MDEDIVGWIICLLIILLIVFCIVVGVFLYHKQDIELEKYKIEMQVKHGDVVEVE